MTVSDNTIKAERQGSCFKISRRFSAEAGKKLTTIILKKSIQLWKLLQTLPQQLQLKALMQLSYRYQK